MNANIRYMTQPTDMDGDTLRSCLAEHFESSYTTPEAVPLTERNTITTWIDTDGNAVACEITDHMDEHGRYRRVRRFITVPDLHPEEYGYLNGHVELMYTCATCDIEADMRCSSGCRCDACHWKEETVGPLTIYVLDKWQGNAELVS